MNSRQIALIFRRGLSAVGVAFLLAYSAHYEWGLSQDLIRFSALGAALMIGMLVAIDHSFRKLK